MYIHKYASYFYIYIKVNIIKLRVIIIIFIHTAHNFKNYIQMYEIEILNLSVC